MRKVERLRERLASSQYLASFLSAVDEGLSRQRRPSGGDAPRPHIVCYGLGHAASSPAPQRQLALLLQLREHLSAPSVEVFDPVFWPEEKQLLRELRLHVLETDEQCARRLSAPAVLYMPHCENAHYDNLLRANWHPDLLPRLLLVGNSLASIALRLPSSQLRLVSFVERAAPHVTERSERIDEADLLPAFNDTAVQWFEAGVLRALPAYFWDEAPQEAFVPPQEGDSSDDGRGKPRRRRRKKSRNHS
ncbi:Protein SENSITIVITY TO RED LIGHT REDUCED 1 [Amphibalanus amphitrite]|uniref:Protein SENSITIVITY TO RED LIGHT REDUCED 1 n=1 Tax=Amphibalanus amphitrite TaxID=1232801 RepID=A0A6A4XB46_AMPAM|nr:Protein SENSITIVITY TO RED LIGHT REDUCED 1 [Amphibalanus amphitrite]